MSDFNPLDRAKIPTHRSSFDLSSKKLFTAKIGEILPCYWQIAIPDTKYRISSDWFTRTVPVNTAAYTRIKEYYDFYAVPLRLISRALPQAFTQMTDYATSAASSTANTSSLTSVPSVTCLSSLNGGSNNPGYSKGLVNMFGFNRGDLSYKLLNYLGYGNIIRSVPSSGNRWWSTSLINSVDFANYTQNYIQNNVVNLFPLLAYQKIYQDFFRWSQWENSNPSSYNVDYFSGDSPRLVTSLPDAGSDYWKSDTMFDLKYCNWNKDMLMGILPNSQFGDVAVVDVSNTAGAVSSSIFLLFVRQKLHYRDWETDRKSTRLNSSHSAKSRMPSSA